MYKIYLFNLYILCLEDGEMVFFEKKLNIFLFLIVIVLFVLFFFLELFVPAPKVQIERIIEKSQFKN